MVIDILRRPWVVFVCAAVSSMAAWADDKPAAADEPESSWNEMQGEKVEALRARGDPARGAIAFENCQGCHRAQALGRPDGSYPRLAGQHDTVLIKQMTDVRAGRRRNEKMVPFIDRHDTSAQDIADIAAYLSRLPVPPTQGQGPGARLDFAAGLYRERCANCHGAGGEGDGPRFYPRVSGQHFKYLLREMIEIRDGQRANANPRMVAIVKPLADGDLSALADLMSRLPLEPAKP